MGFSLTIQLTESVYCQHQGLVFFAEAEPNLLCAERGIGVEARAGDAGDAYFANQVACEFNVVFEAKAADVSHDVISAIWAKRFETRFLKFRQDQIATRAIVGLNLIV